jgi:replicative DNA helicase
LDKVPPHDEVIEKAILGSVLFAEINLNLVMRFVKSEKYFYKHEHAVVWEAISQMHKDEKTIDIITVNHKLKALGTIEEAGGRVAISQLTNYAVDELKLSEYCDLLVQMYLLREMHLVAFELANHSFDTSKHPLELHAEHSKKLEALIGEQSISGFSVPKFLGKKMLDELAERMKADSRYAMRSSIHAIQSKLNGYSKDELIIIAARPGKGKTAYVLSEMYFWGYAGYPIGIFSLEMSAVQLMMRIASMITGINSETLTKKKLSDEEFMKFNQCLGAIESMPFFIDDTAHLNIADLRLKARALVTKHKCRVIIVDYLQLMQGSGRGKGNREAEISEISRGLKLIAKENHVPVIALSQLSRDVEKRGGKPKLSDLRESGSIEQDADVVAFIHRPDDKDHPEDEAYFLIEKNRAGSLGGAKMRWIPEKTLFTNWSTETKSFTETRKDYDNAEPTEDVPF